MAEKNHEKQQVELMLKPSCDVGYDDNSSVDDDSSSVDEAQERGRWGGKMDYLLSLVGYCVGLGTLWRFPYLCNRNGGGAFLIPFFFFLVVSGLPMFFMEVTMAQFAGKGPSCIWDICPLFRGIGIAMPLFSAFMGLYYNMIMAWCIYYIIRSCASTLPWMTCDNWWNTPLCVEKILNSSSNGNDVANISIGTNENFTFVETSDVTTASYEIVSQNVSYVMNGTNKYFYHSSVEEFWQYNTLRASSGLDEIGDVQWHLALCLLGAWVIVFFCLIRGVRSVGKVVYVTATLPYILLMILLIRGLTLPGAIDGIIFFLKPDFSRLLDIQVWLEACLQVFYSLGPAWGGLITMASYNKFNNNCLRDSLIVTSVSAGTSVYSGLVIFTILGVMAHHQGVHVSEVVSSGPGLGFVAYPDALSDLPIPQLWSFIFFVMLFTVGLDSQFVNMEVVITCLCDSCHMLMKRRSILTGVLCFIFFLFGLLLCCNGGIYVFQLLDWYVAAFMLSVGILECVIISWIYGFYRFDKDLEMMIGRKVPRLFKLLLSTIAPLVLLVAAVMTLLKYSTPTYGDYSYPWYTSIIGWLWAATPMLPVPIFMAKELFNAKGSTKQRILQTLTPSSEWQPCSEKHKAMYKHHEAPSFRQSFYSIFRSRNVHHIYE